MPPWASEFISLMDRSARDHCPMRTTIAGIAMRRVTAPRLPERHQDRAAQIFEPQNIRKRRQDQRTFRSFTRVAVAGSF